MSETQLQRVQFDIVLASGTERIITASGLQAAEEGLSTKELDTLHAWLQHHGVLVMSASDVQMREALYYYEKGRKFRPTKGELKKQEFLCPKCKVILVKVRYKLNDHILSCPECRWSIHRDDIWNPQPDEKPEVRCPGDATSNWLKGAQEAEDPMEPLRTGVGSSLLDK